MTLISSDYSVVIIMGVFIFASISWIFSARKWFIGPVRTVDDGSPATLDEKSSTSSVVEEK